MQYFCGPCCCIAANSLSILVTLNSFSMVGVCCGFPTLLRSLARSDTLIPSLGSYPPTFFLSLPLLLLLFTMLRFLFLFLSLFVVLSLLQLFEVEEYNDKDFDDDNLECHLFWFQRISGSGRCGACSRRCGGGDGEGGCCCLWSVTHAIVCV
jgi:Trk-type K+ transport system membrane component